MKLTTDYIESQVADTKYTVDGTFTICTITTKAGIKLVGTSGCLDPKNYVQAVGETIARKNAVEQIWGLEGYFAAKSAANAVSLRAGMLEQYRKGAIALGLPEVPCSSLPSMSAGGMVGGTGAGYVSQLFQVVREGPRIGEAENKGAMLSEFDLEQAVSRGYGKVEKVMHTALLLHEGWEADNAGWIVEFDDGRRGALTTSHGGVCPWTRQDAEEKLAETGASAVSIRKALELWPSSSQPRG